MTSLHRLRKLQFFNHVSSLSFGTNSKSSKCNLYPNGPHPILQFFRFSTTERAGDFNISKRRYLELKRKAQAVLMEYFHETRNLPFSDAESLSRNSPEFLDGLLKTVLTNGDDNGDFVHFLKRHLRYHHVNEFEPFFESIGLKPCEYASFLPRDLDFLSSDQLLLHNYYVLCNYGIEKSRIGKIYVEAKEVFSYDHGILQSRLQSFENLGLPRYLVIDITTLSPHLLRGDNQELYDFFEKFQNVGIDIDWLENHIRGGESRDWKRMLEVMCLLGELGLTNEQSREVILNNPHLLLERSGSCTLCLFSVLLKFGLKRSDVKAVFIEFPQVSVSSFIRNLLHGYQFLVEIKMPSHDVSRMIHLHLLFLGACRLKKVSSLGLQLNCCANQIRKMVEEDPYVLKKWIRGVIVDRLPGPSGVCRERRIKTRFLESLGFVEKSEEMERALRLMWAKGDELQERFDCLVKSGLGRENAVALLKLEPGILNISKDTIERKIDLIVGDLGYPMSSILTHPVLLSCDTKRLKLRLSMHKWLRDEGVTKIGSCLSYLMKQSDECFVRRRVNSHPQGARVWERLKNEINICEYASFLPRDLDFLSGDQLFHNCGVLCKYGIEKSRIGKIYVEAKEVFSYDHGILQSRLQSFENLGLPQYLVIDIITLSPHLLRGDNRELYDFIEKFKNVGIDIKWLEDHIRGGDSRDWKRMLEVMCLLGELGLTNEQSRKVILNNPHLLLEGSGSCTLCLFSVLLKFGLTQSDVKAVFIQFPQVSVSSFIRNLLHGYQFLVEIKMPSHNVSRMIRLHLLFLGTCRLKKVSSLGIQLNCRADRIRKMVEEDPYVLKKWVRGVIVDRLPEPSRACRGRRMKTRFLESLGFVEKSEEMEKVLRLMRAKGDELQERFDCLVKSGLSQENVVAMLKSEPRVFEMSKDAMERKIDVLVRDLGYPVSIILTHPQLLSYNVKRLKLRLSMHKWLKDEGVTKIGSCLSYVMRQSDEYFVRCHVNSHPQGARVWERLKKEIDISTELP